MIKTTANRSKSVEGFIEAPQLKRGVLYETYSKKNGDFDCYALREGNTVFYIYEGSQTGFDCTDQNLYYRHFRQAPKGTSITITQAD